MKRDMTSPPTPEPSETLTRPQRREISASTGPGITSASTENAPASSEHSCRDGATHVVLAQPRSTALYRPCPHCAQQRAAATPRLTSRPRPTACLTRSHHDTRHRETSALAPTTNLTTTTLPHHTTTHPSTLIVGLYFLFLARISHQVASEGAEMVELPLASQAWYVFARRTRVRARRRTRQYVEHPKNTYAAFNAANAVIFASAAVTW